MAKKSVAQNYQLLEIIGRGKFGTVHKAVHIESKLVVAVKILNLDTDEEEVKDIQQEIQFLAKLRSVPNITHYYGSYLNGHKLWIIMDYCAGGSVRTLLRPGPLDEKYISIVARELLIALQFIHKNGVIHRDIKAANILISKEGKVRLCDFGVAAQLTSTALKRTTMAGTPYWMAPEVITEGATYNVKADIWSTGITIYEMATGNPPYSDKDAMRAMQFITQHEPPRLEGRQYGPFLKEIIAMCLEEKPNLRPTAEDLVKSKFVKNSRQYQTVLLKEVIGRYLLWRDKKSSSRESLHDYEPLEIYNMEEDKSYDIKWDFDSLKSAEYIIDNEIDIDDQELVEAPYISDYTEDTYHNSIRDRTMSPFGVTHTIGNTMSETVGNPTIIGSKSERETFSNQHKTSNKSNEVPISLLKLFQDVDDSVTEKKTSVSSSAPLNEVAEDIITPLPTDIRGPVTAAPISIEIPNMDTIENEIQEKERQRSRSATVSKTLNLQGVSNHNISLNNSPASANIDPRPRRPTISLSRRTPSPGKNLESITVTHSNSNLGSVSTDFYSSSPPKGTSMQMKPLQPATSQTFLQPLNHKPMLNSSSTLPLVGQQTLKSKTESLEKLKLNSIVSGYSGPQTAPPVTNSELHESGGLQRVRSQLRIQMPVPSHAKELPIIDNGNEFSKPTLHLNLNGIGGSPTSDLTEKNQFGVEVNMGAGMPMAMTPVTDKPLFPLSVVTPERHPPSDIAVDLSHYHPINSEDPTNANLNSQNSMSASTTLFQGKFLNSIKSSTKEAFPSNDANNFFTSGSATSFHVNGDSNIQNSPSAGHELTGQHELAEQEDVTLTEATIDESISNPIMTSALKSIDTTSLLTTSLIDAKESMNRIVSFEFQSLVVDEDTQTHMYLDEVEGLLGKMGDLFSILVEELK